MYDIIHLFHSHIHNANYKKKVTYYYKLLEYFYTIFSLHFGESIKFK
jgi:hypothetical protein